MDLNPFDNSDLWVPEEDPEFIKVMQEEKVRNRLTEDFNRFFAGTWKLELHKDGSVGYIPDMPDGTLLKGGLLGSDLTLRKGAATLWIRGWVSGYNVKWDLDWA